MSDWWTVVRKEIIEMVVLWRGRGKIHFLMLIGVFGIYFPWSIGPKWITSPATMLSFTWFPLMMVTSITADAFAGERERHTLETLLATRLPDHVILAGKLSAAVLYGLFFLWLFVLSGLVTVNTVHAKGGWIFFSRSLFTGFVLLGTLGALFAAALGVIVSLKSSTVRQAQQTLNLAIIGLIVVAVGIIAFLPDAWRQAIGQRIARGDSMQLVLAGAGLLVALDAAALYAARRMFRRTRLLM